MTSSRSDPGGVAYPMTPRFPAVDLSLVDRLNSAPVAIEAVMIVAFLALLCIGMTALLRSKPENVPETLHGSAAIFRAIRKPWRRRGDAAGHAAAFTSVSEDRPLPS